jgi:hypothetical protein
VRSLPPVRRDGPMRPALGVVERSIQIARHTIIIRGG